MPESNLIEILRRFHDNGCEFILVGGLAAVLHGTPIQTYDVDIVYSWTPQNLQRLLATLESLDAVFRMQPHRRLRPNLSHFSATGHLNLLTSAGPVDLLGSIGVAKQLGYRDLLPLSEAMRITHSMEIPVLKLETLIKLKEELGGEKDRAILPSLRQTLRLRQHKGDDQR